MKITLSIDEEFAGADALLEFAAKLAAVFKLPSDALRRAAANVSATSGVASGAEKTSVAVALPPTATEVPIQVAALTPLGDTGFEVIAPAETSVPAVPPADTKPRARRGRPSNAETAAKAATPDLPKASTGGAAGVSAPANPIQKAIAAGAVEADEHTAFLMQVNEHINAHGSEGLYTVLASCKDANGNPCGRVRDVPVEKRTAFIERLRATASIAA